MMNNGTILFYNYEVLDCYYNRFREIICYSKTPNDIVDNSFLSFIFLFGLFASCTILTCTKNKIRGKIINVEQAEFAELDEVKDIEAQIVKAEIVESLVKK